MRKTLFFAVILCSSCKYEKAEPLIACETPSVVSFQKDIQPIFDAHCNTAGCHSGSNPEGNLNLEPSQSYAQLWKKGKGYIDTLNPKFSVFYASMNSTSNPMPPTGKLDACTLALVLKWIEQKAPNN
ncbi:MAG TPA: hypothetical protein VFF27_02330 [Bacteroidia bacterium]|nr:hypothetical protein [Bacteroidia bacterium]